MLEEKDDTILARWLSGEISPGDRQLLENSEGYADYVKIVEGLDRFIKPDFDPEALREKIQKDINLSKSSKTIRFKPWHYGVAASILIVFSLAFFLREVQYVTLPGEQLTVSLPDGSTARLNADSHIKRSRFFWTAEQGVDLLRGEVFFEVERGDGFQVSTPVGKVEVLGTKFTVKSRENYFEVACYQGTVRFVESQTGTGTLLTQGQRFKGVDGNLERGTLDGQMPPWMEGESIFENVPLNVVLLELGAQYGITFDTMDVDLDEKYTGGFVHGNMALALATVLLPMDIQYQVSSDNRTVVLSPMD